MPFARSLLLLAATLPPQAHHHWRETAAETLYTTLYKNCDYAYTVTLPPGVVAHGTHSPSPNHGFLLSLRNLATDAEVTSDQPRWIAVDASYNAGDSDSPTARARRHLTYYPHQGAAPLHRNHLLADHASVSFQSHHGKVIHEETLTIRHGIVYSVSLQTAKQHAAHDHRVYIGVIRALHFLPPPTGECSNE